MSWLAIVAWAGAVMSPLVGWIIEEIYYQRSGDDQ